MMNNDNQISKQTILFGYIGEHAGTSRLSAILNKKFKQNADDVMIIPMNIREDDLYFTVTNMKKSQVTGAIISNEYVNHVIDTLDVKSSLVEKSGMCDILFKDGEQLRGDVFITRVLLEKLKDLMVSKIAIIGTNHHAKAFSLLGCGFNVSYFNENLEELMEFCNFLEMPNADMNRIADGMEIDLSVYDAVVDCSDLKSLDMIDKLPKYCFDMKNKKEISNMKIRASHLNATYIGYDEMIEDIASKAYERIIKG